MAIPIGEYKQAVEALAQRMKAFYDKAIVDIEKEWKRNYIKGSKFANEIEALAQKTNQEIDDKFIERFCHKAVMTLMLKFLFLRFAEDKKVLKPHFKSDAIKKWENENKSAQDVIREAFSEAKERFKGLYKITPYDEFLPTEETLKIYLIDALSDEPKSGLYKNKGSLDFATLDPRVVSAFYEKLFDRKKRKELGLFFTPPVIAEYLVEKAFEGQKITKDFLVLDPACGSGQILLAAYKKLKDIFVNQLGMMPGEAHKQILSHNLWGIDIEPFAVLLSKINLAIQDLENVPEYINIIHGDSLLETGFDIPQMAMLKDVGEGQKQKLIQETIKLQGGKEITIWRNGTGRILLEKPIEQKQFFELAERMKTGIFFEEVGIRTMEDLPKEFDAVVANPPYINVRLLRSEYKGLLQDKFSTAYKGYDIYILFIELGISKLKLGGRLSYISSNKFLSTDYGEKIREWILSQFTISEIVDVSKISVFEDAGAYPIVYTIIKTKPKENNITIKFVSSFNNFEKQLFESFFIPQDFIKELRIIPLINYNEYLLIQKINCCTKKISPFVGKVLSGTTGFDYRRYGSLITEKQVDKLSKKFIITTNIFPYYIKWGQTINYWGKDISTPYFRYSPRIISKGRWRLYNSSKIVVRGMATNLTAAIDENGDYALGVSVYAVIDLNMEPKYILCLLNSKLLDRYYKLLFLSKHLAGGYIGYNAGQLEQLPIYPATPDQQKPFIEMADKMLELNKKLQETEKSFYEFVEEKIKSKISLREAEGLDFVNIKDSRAKLGEKSKINAAQEENILTVFINKKPTLKIICEDKISSEFLSKYLDGLKTNILSGQDGDFWIERILNTKIHWNEKLNLEKLLKEYKVLQSSAEEIKKQIAETDKKIDEMVFDLYGITEEERKIIKGQK